MSIPLLRRALLFAGLLPVTMYAHAGKALEPHDLWTAWRFDPGVVIPMVLSAFLYAKGAAKASGIETWQKACFWSGIGTLAVALMSPLHPLGEALFSAHMVQHEVLMLISAPLLAISRPLVPFLWGMPFAWRKALGRWSKHPAFAAVWRSITRPLAAGIIHAVAIWAWHAPSLFGATLSSEWAHSAQHISFFGSALLFWWSLFHAHGARSYGSGVLYLFATAVHTSILGALLTLSRMIWYPAYKDAASAWGLSPLEDQQLGGLIMWVPGGIVYVAVGLAMLAAWLRESEAMAQRRSYAD